jgi:hypothetical protein
MTLIFHLMNIRTEDLIEPKGAYDRDMVIQTLTPSYKRTIDTDTNTILVQIMNKLEQIDVRLSRLEMRVDRIEGVINDHSTQINTIVHVLQRNGLI